ncbi:S8 family serine peptidase [Algoriphagus marinus]|uniref:S8 family serine peptidase n=1 Tax=Algoriphagus marinus TaxID=1925762 RepID=UPI00094BACAD|nr:S8 family serine peptidase [Algoriphagus marinus]
MAMIKRTLFLLFFCSLGLNLFAQDRYAVFYKFKPQTSLSLERPEEFLSQKALNRRAKEGVQADSLDLPVAKKYEDKILGLSNYILYSSKWFNATIAVTDEAGAIEMASLPFVEKVELVGRSFIPSPNARLQKNPSVSIRHKFDPPIGENQRSLAAQENSYDFQNELLGINQMLEEGYSGEGITIAVFDAGFPGVNTSSALSHLETNNQILAKRDFVRPWNTDVYQNNQHGTNVLSLIASKDPNVLLAGAPDANYILVMTEEVATEYRVEEFNWVRGAEFADSLGVDIISSSVGYWDFDDSAMNYTVADLDGETTVITKGATIAASKGILVINSSGNYGSGESSLVAPADARGILAIGAVNKDLSVSAFSSRGPTGDGRIKPDLATFGNGVALVRFNGSVGFANGTSFSAPQITALAAGLWQAEPKWTKDKLIQRLLESGTQADNPDNLIGFGIPNFRDALYGEILSVEENREETLWKVYPNPLVSDQLQIFFGTSTSSEFTLLDMNGRQLIKSNLNRYSIKDPYQITLEGINQGIYLIQMQDGQQIKHAKLYRH